jgi:hypothetical protein
MARAAPYPEDVPMNHILGFLLFSMVIFIVIVVPAIGVSYLLWRGLK